MSTCLSVGFITGLGVQNKLAPECVCVEERHNFMDDGLMATHVTLVAVVGWLVFDPTLIGNLLAVSHQLVPQDLDVLHGLQHAVSGREVTRPTLMVAVYVQKNIYFFVHVSLQ